MRTNLIAAAAAASVMAALAIVFAVSGSDQEAARERFPSTTVATTVEPDSTLVVDDVTSDSATVSTFSDLPTIALDQLPIEALDTLRLIESDGPYPYRQDDGVFQNREGILPDRPPNHYREYTVETPGSPDRGARRIVSGNDGERYYTDDHYDSFREILLHQGVVDP